VAITPTMIMTTANSRTVNPGRLPGASRLRVACRVTRNGLSMIPLMPAIDLLRAVVDTINVP